MVIDHGNHIPSAIHRWIVLDDKAEVFVRSSERAITSEEKTVCERVSHTHLEKVGLTYKDAARPGSGLEGTLQFWHLPDGTPLSGQPNASSCGISEGKLYY